MGVGILRGFQYEFLTNPHRFVEIAPTDILIDIIPIWFLCGVFNLFRHPVFHQDTKDDHGGKEDGDKYE